MTQSKRRFIALSFFSYAAATALLAFLPMNAAAVSLLATIPENESYTAFDFSGQTQQATYASFSLEFRNEGVSLSTGQIPFAGPFPFKTVFGASDSGFNQMAALLSDDIDGSLTADFDLWLANGQHQQPKVGGSTGPESILVRRHSDVVRSTISALEFEVGFMSHLVSGTNERLSVSASWKIIGEPIPEPSAPVVFAIELAIPLLARQRCREPFSRPRP